MTHSTSNANVSYDESGVYEINNDVLLPVKFCISFRISENCCLGIFADDFFSCDALLFEKWYYKSWLLLGGGQSEKDESSTDVLTKKLLS